MEPKTIAVSACLLGRDCKYNGGNNRHDGVLDFCEGKHVIPVCPEVEAGLPTPRIPMEIVNGRVTDRNGTDHHDAMMAAVEKLVRKLMQAQVECVILQSRSPSCGVREVYDGSFSGKRIPGSGVFAQALKEAGIKVVDAESFDMKSQPMITML